MNHPDRVRRHYTPEDFDRCGVGEARPEEREAVDLQLAGSNPVVHPGAVEAYWHGKDPARRRQAERRIAEAIARIPETEKFLLAMYPPESEA